MSRVDGDDLAQLAERILSVDAKRDKDDDFKLPEKLRALVDTRLKTYRDAEQVKSAVSGKRSGHSVQAKQAFKDLRERVRDGYKFLDALPSFRVPADQKLAAMLSYGFTGGKIGDLLRKDRVLALARQAVAITPSVQPDAAQYPSDLVLQLTNLLNILAEAEPGSLVGNRAAATQARNKAQKDLSKIVRRVRHFYLSASDDLDETTELGKVGFNPVRRSGQRRTAAELPLGPTSGASDTPRA